MACLRVVLETFYEKLAGFIAFPGLWEVSDFKISRTPQSQKAHTPSAFASRPRPPNKKMPTR